MLYRPDWQLTEKAIGSLAGQTDFLCVVDNTPDADESRRFAGSSNIVYIPLKANLGIAAAQNRGIDRLLHLGADFILFSDQDSLAPSTIVERLLAAHEALAAAGVAVAAVGTRAINRQTGLPYPPKSKELGPPAELLGIAGAPAITECYSVRSSISIIPAEALRKVGGFDESLFIDGVDHEWGWRAWHSARLRSFITEEARIDHMLGEGDHKVAGRSLAMPSPARVYYQFRNFVLLSRRSTTPRFWIKQNLLKFAVKSIYFPIMLKPRALYLKNILRGVAHGLKSSNSNPSWPHFQKI